MPEKLSAFVITYNRAALLEACLRAASFADELIVVDKSSTDGSPAVAARYASRVEIVPWSPTVEETRAFALSLCRHDRVLYLDDDEILSPETGPYLRDRLDWTAADVYTIASRHYILGLHDERAYYWPEVHPRLFRKGAVEFTGTVHGGVVVRSARLAGIPVESGVCVHHLSHPDVHSWIEKTNRYTSRPDRVSAMGGEADLVAFARDRITYWVGRTADPFPGGYPAAVALLRAIYDMVDRLKAWETTRGLDGALLLELARDHLAPGLAMTGQDRGPSPERGDVLIPGQATGSGTPAGRTGHAAIQALLTLLRGTEDALHERTEAARSALEMLADCQAELTRAQAERDDARRMLTDCQAALTGMRADLALGQAMLADCRADLTRARADHAEARAGLVAATADLARLSGSARLFLRQYLPRLRRHLGRSPVRFPVPG